MNIKEISKEIYQNNKAKGFWDEKRNVGEMLMLVVSELAEALEADRKGGKFNLTPMGQEILIQEEDNEDFKSQFVLHVKDSFEDELADAVIRLFDMSAGLGIDLEWHIAAKMRYNKLRPHKHGKAY